MDNRNILPILKDNYLKDLSNYSTKLFTEASPQRALELIDPSIMSQINEVYFSNNPDLALGQGNNKGVLLELDSNNLKGQVNKSKPSFAAEWNRGNAEFIGRTNSQDTYRKNVKQITIKDINAIKNNSYGRRLAKFLTNNPLFTEVAPGVFKSLNAIDPYPIVFDMMKLQGIYPYSQKEIKQFKKRIY